MDKVTLYDLRVVSTLCNGYSATRSHVRALVTKAWPQLPEHTINIHTLDFDPQFPDLTPGIPQLMIATLSLENPPSTLLPPSDTSVTVTDKTGKLYDLQLTLKPDVVTLTEKQKACLQQLSFPHQNYREADIELAEGSCDWIIHHDSFRAWPEAPRKLLWVCGPSGAGKSTVMKRITQHLRSEDDRLVLSYFFDGRPSFIHNSREGCYRHLLAQMLPHESRYTTELERMCKRLSDAQVVKDSSNSMADFLRVHYFGSLPSIAKRIPVTLVIDGLEEAGAMDMVKDFLATTHGSKLDTRERFPFADYLVSSLDYHLRELDDAGVPLPNLVDYSFWSPEVSPFKTWRYLSIALHPHNKLASVFDTSYPISRPTDATTPLHYIAEHSFFSSIQPALASFSPAHLSLHDATGHTPLTAAIMTRNFTLATALVVNPKINPNIPDATPTRHTPLIHAIRLLLSTRHVDDDAHANGMDASKTLLTTLLANPLTDPSLRDADNRTPLSHAAQTRSLSAFTAILDTVIAAGAAATHNPTDGDGDIAKTINEQDAVGRTPLSYAAEAASAGVVKKLLSLSARTDLHDARGMTALDYAVRTEGNRWGVGRVVGLLLGAQAIRNSGVAPIEPKAVLEWAVEGGRVEVVRSVLDEEMSRGLYLDDRLLERVREMAGAKNEGDQQSRRVYEDWSGEDGARQWLRVYLPEVERKAGNMNEIKRMMEERRRKKLKEEQLEKAKAGERVSSKL
ncbi:putative ankyrin repeat domain-containing protein [Diplodia seriata]|uniref:Putative ankyrin repeat domain-containing protein n=1 Tax=Diplodia seriata TaxID=420778 RepID=A0A0G2EML8_9PEZI|nr:putative ankyrin repeat domain-containing protein [Diplodia seriata]